MSTLICPNCNYQTNNFEFFCSNCGTKLVPVCHYCGAELKPNAKFCSQCGEDISKGFNAEDVIATSSYSKSNKEPEPIQLSLTQLSTEQDYALVDNGNINKNPQGLKTNSYERDQYLNRQRPFQANDNGNKSQDVPSETRIVLEGKSFSRSDICKIEKYLGLFTTVYSIFFLSIILTAPVFSTWFSDLVSFLVSAPVCFDKPGFIAYYTFFISMPFALVLIILLQKAIRNNVAVTAITSVLSLLPLLGVFFCLPAVLKANRMLKNASVNKKRITRSSLAIVGTAILILIIAAVCKYPTEFGAMVGIPAKQFDLGVSYLQFMTPNKNKAAEKWFRKAAEKDYCPAQYMLSGSKRTFELDSAEAEKWHKKSIDKLLAWADSGNVRALYALGANPGLPNETLYTKEQRLHSAAVNGYVPAQVALGILKSHAPFIDTASEEDLKEAVKWYRKAAEQGHPLGQICLGSYYESGTGVILDEKEAVKWYRKAAEQGHPLGQFLLGACYENGTGVPIDNNEAKKWYYAAATQGYKDAQEAYKRFDF